MSKRTNRTLPPEIRGIVRYRLEHYHMNKQELTNFYNEHINSKTAQLSHERKARGGVNRTTENEAMRFVENTYLREIEKSVTAIEYVINRLTVEDRKLVEMVYWRNSHTITGAGMELSMSQRTAYRHADMILKALAVEMGLLPA